MKMSEYGKEKMSEYEKDLEERLDAIAAEPLKPRMLTEEEVEQLRREGRI